MRLALVSASGSLNNEILKDEEKNLIPLKKRKTELVQRLNTLIQMRADGEISQEQLKNMKSSSQLEIDTLSFNILSIKEQSKNWKKYTKEKLDFLLTSKNTLENVDKKMKKELLSKIGSNLKLKDKSLYFIRDIGLTAIGNLARAYTKEKSRLEPKIPIVNKGEFNDFDLLFPKLWTELNAIRTCQIDNFS